jgi:hypothetical protein
LANILDPMYKVFAQLSYVETKAQISCWFLKVLEKAWHKNENLLFSAAEISPPQVLLF